MIPAHNLFSITAKDKPSLLFLNHKRETKRNGRRTCSFFTPSESRPLSLTTMLPLTSLPLCARIHPRILLWNRVSLAISTSFRLLISLRFFQPPNSKFRMQVFAALLLLVAAASAFEVADEAICFTRVFVKSMFASHNLTRD
jgi:hypothetical protein